MYKLYNYFTHNINYIHINQLKKNEYIYNDIKISGINILILYYFSKYFVNLTVSNINFYINFNNYILLYILNLQNYDFYKIMDLYYSLSNIRHLNPLSISSINIINKSNVQYPLNSDDIENLSTYLIDNKISDILPDSNDIKYINVVYNHGNFKQIIYNTSTTLHVLENN